MEDRKLSNEWGDLQEADKVPAKGAGATAERVERDKERQRRRFPSEDKRVGRKVSPTLSAKLIRRLKAICKEQGYIDKSGDGRIASSVIEDLLWYAVGAYDRGELETEEVVVTQVQRRLRAKD